MTESVAAEESEGAGPRLRREALVVLTVGVSVLLVAAFRATRSVSFYDDSHYVTMALRMANGALPFRDEMSLQSPGFILPAAFTWVWTRLVGMDGLVLAYRHFYLVLAGLTALVVYRALRPSFRPVAAGLAALVPLLCTPFNLVAPGYNTIGMLGSAIAVACGFAAVRDGSRRAAVLAGIGLAVMSVSYLPLAFGATVLFGVLLLAGGRRLAGPVLLGAGAGVVLLLGWLVPFVTVEDVRRSFAYASSNVIGFASPMAKLDADVHFVVRTLLGRRSLPLVVLAVVATLPKVPAWLRGLAFAGLPVAAALPGITWLVRSLGPPPPPDSGVTRLIFGNTAGSWMIVFVLGAAVPVALWAWRSRNGPLLLALRLSVPAGVVGALTVAYSTNASLTRSVPVVGLLPLSVVVLAGWAQTVHALSRPVVPALASASLLAAVVFLLTVVSLDDETPLSARATMHEGAYAEMHTSNRRMREMAGLRASASRYVAPTDRVTFLGERQGYLLAGGVPYTNAVWLYPGPSDVAALEYFGRRGAMPEVVFVDVRSWAKTHDSYVSAAATDPLLARVLRDYRHVDTAADFAVYVRR